MSYEDARGYGAPTAFAPPEEPISAEPVEPVAPTPQPEDHNDDDVPEMRKVTILMPDWMHEDLKRRARRRGVSVTELMRQAVVLDKLLFDDPDVEVLLKKGNELQKLFIAR